ncbi:hypothetical protein CCR75_008716 [Bremia lactucae]|uniref:Uncharacterized protein n=1 Tax=Bremia lactucae TaxID=4779 RepID=A0A976IK77_BRELC|nr:hypothetical protein CCR75_008716 [Bremia lactucae]
MKRNFGSLNLVALDLSSPFQKGAESAEHSLSDRFSAINPSAEDCSMDPDASDCSGDENVGFPMERLSADMQSASELLRVEDIDLHDTMPELTLPVRSRTPPPHNKKCDAQASSVLYPSVTELSHDLHDYHHVELNALRCLNLKVMLSNTKLNYSCPGVNGRTKAALLPIHHPSLQSA